MLEAIVAFSVRRRGVVLVAWAAVAVFSAFMVRKLSIDAVPDVTNTQVGILTTAPGLSPLDVEQYLTYPVETAMNGLPGVAEIRSTSRAAISSVTVVFNDATDVWFARQLVSERLKIAEGSIPPGYGSPELAPVSTGLGQIYEFYLYSPTVSPMELRSLLDWNVAYKLRSVPGVVEVNAMGGESKEYQVVLDAKRMAAYRLTLRHVHETLVQNNAALGGGYIEKNGEAYVIRADAQFKGIDDIGGTVVATDADGTPVLLKQIADVRVGPALRFGTVTKHGEGHIAAGTVMMLVGANSRKVVADVKAKLAAIQTELPQGVEIRTYYDRAQFIDRMLETVTTNLAEGASLVVLVLLLTLGSLRGALIAALAIPLAMGIAVTGMVFLGVTGNLMSLGAIDFGLLVDGAIVMLEVTLAELARRAPEDRDAIAHEVSVAMQRAARPVAFSLLIILLVYLPLMALEGVEGRMFRPMAITIALALFGALAFSLTAFPALAAFTLAPTKKSHAAGRGVFGRLGRAYLATLDVVLPKRTETFAVALSALVVAGFVATSLGAEFVPRLDEGELSLDVRRLPSVSITEAERLGVQVEATLARFPEVLSVVSRTGRAEVATDPVGPDEAEVRARLAPKETWTTATDLDDLGDRVKRAIEDEVPATFVGISQPIEDRVNQLLAGSHADVAIKVFGEDLAVLKATGDKIADAIRDVPGRGDLRVQRVLGLPLLDVRPDRARLARYGIPAEDVLEVVEASRVGKNAGRVFEGARRFDLRLVLPPAALTPEAFGELPVGTNAGQLIPIAAVASVTETEGPAVINRESLERRVLVEANVRGRDLVSFVNDAKRAVAHVSLPKGVHLEWGGQFENFERASARLGVVVPIALSVIFCMLFLMFGDARSAIAVFAGVPFALIGGILALAVRALPFSIPAAVGFVAVGGVAVLNGVVMASEVRRRLDSGQDERDAVRQGAVSVLRPVVTTALVAAIGFMPMALSNRAGAEVQRPLATVVIGGILSSTVLSLLVLPVLLEALMRSSPRTHSDSLVPSGPKES